MFGIVFSRGQHLVIAPITILSILVATCAISSVVERFIDIEEAGSSILPSRTELRKGQVVDLPF